MKNLRILFIISLSFVYLNGISFINFDFYSSLDKIDDNDVLIGFQFFDSNGDGIKVIYEEIQVNQISPQAVAKYTMQFKDEYTLSFLNLPDHHTEKQNSEEL